MVLNLHGHISEVEPAYVHVPAAGITFIRPVSEIYRAAAKLIDSPR